PCNMIRHSVRKKTFTRASRWSLHDIFLCLFSGQRQAGKTIRYEIDPKNVYRQKRDRQSNQRSEEDRPDLGAITGHNIFYKLSDIIIDTPAFPYSSNNGSKIIVQQYHVSCLFCYIGSINTHRYADIGSLQRWSVIYSVASHRYKMFFPLKRFYNI